MPSSVLVIVPAVFNVCEYYTTIWLYDRKTERAGAEWSRATAVAAVLLGSMQGIWGPGARGSAARDSLTYLWGFRPGFMLY